MSDFEEYIKVNYPRDYERQKRIYPDQSVEELYSEDYKMWQHQQAIIDNLKAQLNNMEQCYIQLKQINNEQAEIIRGHFSARQEMKKCIDAALYDIAQAKDGFYGYSSLGGDVDNLTKNIEKSLRGER